MRKIKRGDEVVVIAGKERGKRGKVLRVLGDRVIVQGVRIVKKHQKPNPVLGIEGGILEKEAPIHISNVMLYNPKTGRGDRVGFKFLEDGRKVRYFKSTGDIVPEPERGQ